MIVEAWSDYGGKWKNEPKLIVVHSMAEFIVGDGFHDHAVKFLDKIGLSAHSLIDPSGINYRLRREDQIAWHAKGFNDNSLGIEFLVPGQYNYAEFLERIKTPYLSDEQYQEGLAQIREWLDGYEISQIRRHSDVDPVRKFDPGAGFPWERLLEDLGYGS